MQKHLIFTQPLLNHYTQLFTIRHSERTINVFFFLNGDDSSVFEPAGRLQSFDGGDSNLETKRHYLWRLEGGWETCVYATTLFIHVYKYIYK